MNERLPVDTDHPSLPEECNRQIERPIGYTQALRAPLTLRAYASDWNIFINWCDQHGITALPATADTVATFAIAEADAGINPNTIVRRVAAIAYYHRQAGHTPPNAVAGAEKLSVVLTCIRAIHSKPKKRKTPAITSVLCEILEVIAGDGLREARDRAIFAIGMSAALRRSELVAFDVEDVRIAPDGLLLRVGRPRPNPAREGQEIAILEGCRIKPKALLLDWMMQAGHQTGPLFRRLTRCDWLTEQRMSDRAIARVVQRRATAAGYDPTNFAGHSLRSGFLAEVANGSSAIFEMMEVGRHRSVQALSEYVQKTDQFQNHAGAGFL